MGGRAKQCVQCAQCTVTWKAQHAPWCTLLHAEKQSTVRSASTAAYVITSDYRDDMSHHSWLPASPVSQLLLPPQTLSPATLISPYVTPAIGKNVLPGKTSISTPIPSPGWGATSAHSGTTVCVCVWDECVTMVLSSTRAICALTIKLQINKKLCEECRSELDLPTL